MKQFSIIALMFTVSYSFAQDTLYTVSGQKIPAKVVEINQNEIKYKKANNPDGPVYVVDKTDIALIEYKNGTKELFGTGSGSQNSDNTDQSVANNNVQPRPRVNLIIGGGWGWPVFNSWGWWGGYRTYPRYRNYGYHHYGHYRSRAHYHYGRRGR